MSMKRLTLIFAGFLGGGLCGVVTTASAGSASSSFNFTATFVGGSCAINVRENIQFNGGDLLLSTEIEEQAVAATETFDLTLSKCAGWGLTPSIKVSGKTTTSFGPALFRDALGERDSNGYGILLTTAGNASFDLNNNLAANGVIPAKNWSTSNQLSSIETTLPMVATLTCGDCNYAGRQGGEFKATVTFDFVYE
ncbi:fimbrial protein [Providencia burhodogranariea]|uniref:Putative fimbrial-like protein n=1 Tax=Providencia burhodogranariea DSM 19968 TaxID=1141662 RepID=K8WQ12_9GAMM|nr:fimbrial protein [Providencia burhodogranariea]EKT62036.1 putative fimbrial-like protein [Providencia burhodogranariea DSM 19968]